MRRPGVQKTLSFVQYAFYTAPAVAALETDINRLLTGVLGQPPLAQQGLAEHRRVTSASYGGPQELTARLLDRAAAELIWFQRGDFHCVALLMECKDVPSRWPSWLLGHANRARDMVQAAEGFEVAAYVDLLPWPHERADETVREAIQGVLPAAEAISLSSASSTVRVARAPGRWWIVVAPSTETGSSAAAHYLLKLDRGTLPLALLARTALRHEIAYVAREVGELRASVAPSASWSDAATAKVLGLRERLKDADLHASLAGALEPAPPHWQAEIAAEVSSGERALADIADALDRAGGPRDATTPYVSERRAAGKRRRQSTSTERAAAGSGDVMTGFQVGIVTMKEEEYDALLDKLEPTGREQGEHRDYDVAVIATPTGTCRVAITRCVQQGNAHAQNAASEMLSDLSPSFILVVGIAGGVPTSDFCLGDVVVSDYIQDLTQEDTGTAPDARRFNALGGPLHPSASRIVERLRAVERQAPAWSTARLIGRARPGLDGAHTTEDQSWNAEIDRALLSHAGRKKPKATARKIASSDRLVKDPELIGAWRAVLKAVAAVEMESAGVYVTCQRRNVPFLAIRGISDIVGWRRDEAWTLYACHTAACYARMLIRAGVFCSATDAAAAGTDGRGRNLVAIHGDVQTVITAGRDITIHGREGDGDS